MVYVIMTIEHENGGRANETLVGAFGSKDIADNMLEKTFHEMCEKYGVKELGECDYYTRGDSFNIEDADNCSYECYGNIYECELVE